MAAGVPIIDTAMAIIRRLRAHQSVIAPDAGHIHHRLLNAGFTQGKTVGIMCLWTAVLAVCSLVLAESDGIWRVVAIIIAALITGFAIGKLKLLEPVLRHHYNPRQKPPKNK
jgi:UDP-GlcNAc:undecaprenyl-phosphate GlcNAc-1-phosphate transferase